MQKSLGGSVQGVLKTSREASMFGGTVMAKEPGVSPGGRPWCESQKGLGVSFQV